MDYNLLAGKMKQPKLFDTRNCVQQDVAACDEIQMINFGNLYQFIK